MVTEQMCYNGRQINARALLATTASVAEYVTELKENASDVAQPTIHPSAHLLQEQVWNLNLERADKYVLLALARCSVDGLVEIPSGSWFIEYLTGCNRNAVSTTIRRLRAKGILIAQRDAGRDPVTNRFTSPSYIIDITGCEELTAYVPRIKRPKKTRRQLIEKHNATCFYCQRVGTKQTGPDGEPWEVDRVKPRAKGGGYEPSNIVLACALCNRRKGKK